MKYMLILGLLALPAAPAQVATPIPADLVGVWATQGSQFHGEALWTGAAIYLAANGSGAVAGGDGNAAHAAIIGVRLVVTAYDPATHVITIDATDGNQHMSGKLSYDRASKSIVSSFDKAHYAKRFDSLSDDLLKAFAQNPH